MHGDFDHKSGYGNGKMHGERDDRTHFGLIGGGQTRALK